MTASPAERIRAVWIAPNRGRELNHLVEQLAAEGIARAALDDALGALLDDVRAAGGNEVAEELIAEVGDRLYGWCHASCRIPTADATLTPQTQPETAREPVVH